MRRHLGALLAAAALVTAGCGSSASSTSAQDPGAGPSSGAPSGGASSPAGVKVHLFSQSGGGGAPSLKASPLNTPGQVAAFSRQFRVPAMRHRIEALTSKLDGAADLEGAVIAVGCDRPPGATVEVGAGGTVTITPHDVESPLPECLVAVTTVAVAEIPQG